MCVRRNTAARCAYRVRRAIALGCALGLAGVLIPAYTGAAPVFQGPPVVMGILAAFTGPLSDFGAEALQGSEVAKAEINAAGGILGRRLEIVHEDTQGDAADTVPAITKLITVDHVVGIIGPTTTEYYAAKPIFDRYQIPDEMQGGDVALDHNTDPFMWRDSPSDSQMGVAMALYAHRVGYKRGALMFYEETSAQTLKGPLKAAFEKLGGQIVADVNIQGGQTSYRSEVERLIRANPQVIFTQTDPGTAAVLFGNFKELDNLKIPFIGTDMTGGADYLKAVGYVIANQHLMSVYGTNETGAGPENLNKWFAKVFPGKDLLANANYAYDAVISLALAIDKAHSTEGPAINANMMAVTNPPGTECYSYATCLALLKAGKKINLQGSSGDLDYNKYHNVFGPFAAFRVGLHGHEHQVVLMSAKELAAATP
jgi:branched-chain amino acid transport system substrate-binding protein